MAGGIDDNISNKSLGTTKSDPKESDEESQGVGSLSDLIASTRKVLFESALPVDDEKTVTATQMRKWAPNKKTGGSMKEDIGTLGSSRKAALFAEGTNFATREVPPVTKTTAKDTTTKVNNCVVKLQHKILHGNNVQETVLGMIDHCLTILHKRDKRARFVNKKKLLEAYKVTDFPRDFTDFYDDWGKWDEPVQAFLNTIWADKSHSFMGLFNFKCKWDPAQLFEKTLLKMAGQKYKGTNAIKLKPCQHLDTTGDIIFFNPPFCSDEGLCITLHNAMRNQKSALIKRHPSKYPRLE